MRAINSTAFPTRVDANRKHAVSFKVTLLEGVGHFPQIENPEVFQSHLRTVVEQQVGTGLSVTVVTRGESWASAAPPVPLLPRQSPSTWS